MPIPSDGHMMRLAWIKITNNQGKDLVLAVEDLKSVTEDGDGSLITFWDDRPPIRSTKTAAEVHTEIDTLWTEYTT